MKSSLWLFSVLLLTVACQPNQKTEIKVDPVSAEESRKIQHSLMTGQDPEEVVTTPSNCPVPQIQGLNVQGSVQVPEDYENPQGRKIHVFYYGRLLAGREPIVFYNGGPGSDSHGSAEIIDTVVQSKYLSFIYIDQRGTGCSDPFPTEPTAETVERLTHYGSTEIVKDSEIVREKLLGAQGRWKIFGQSYGGMIVHRYSMVAPQSVKAAYAHGFSLMKNSNDWLTLRIKSQKRVADLYFQKYPEDQKKLAQIRSSISEDLCFTDTGTEICGPKVMDALTIFLGFTTSWPSLHASIGRLLDENENLQMEALKKFVRNYVFGVYNNSGLAGSVITVVEISSGASDAEVCEYAQKKLAAEGETPESWLINECRLLAGMKNDKWTELLKGITVQKQMTPEMLKTALNQSPNLPFYLYSGVKDVFVPIETFKEEVTTLGSRITYREFPESGHEGFYTEPLVWKDLLTVH